MIALQMCAADAGIASHFCFALQISIASQQTSHRTAEQHESLDMVWNEAR